MELINEATRQSASRIQAVEDKIHDPPTKKLEYTISSINFCEWCMYEYSRITRISTADMGIRRLNRIGMKRAILTTINSKKEELETVRDLSKSLLSNRPEKPVFGTPLVDKTFCGRYEEQRACHQARECPNKAINKGLESILHRFQTFEIHRSPLFFFISSPSRGPTRGSSGPSPKTSLFPKQIIILRPDSG